MVVQVGRLVFLCLFLFKLFLEILIPTQVCLLPFLALAIGRASLNSGLLREHMCWHIFLPAHVFPSSLGNIPGTEMGGSPFPHGGVILDMGRCPTSGVA